MQHSDVTVEYRVSNFAAQGHPNIRRVATLACQRLGLHLPCGIWVEHHEIRRCTWFDVTTMTISDACDLGGMNLHYAHQLSETHVEHPERYTQRGL